MNTITITGRLGADPEMRYAGDGRPRTGLRVADGSKGRDGTEETLWWNVTLWGDEAEQGADVLRKGMKVQVTGRAHLHLYTKRDGSPGFALEVKYAKVRVDDQPPTQREVEALGGDDLPF